MNKRAFLFELMEFDPEIVAAAKADPSLDEPARVGGWEVVSVKNHYTRPAIEITCFGDTEQKFVMGMERNEVTIEALTTADGLRARAGQSWPPDYLDLDEEFQSLRLRGRLCVLKCRAFPEFGGSLLDGPMRVEITGTVVGPLALERKLEPEPEPVAVEPLPRRAMKLGGWKETE